MNRIHQNDLAQISDETKRLFKHGLKLNNRPNQSFVTVMLAFSLFGSFWPHHANSGKERDRINFRMREPAGDWDHTADGFYTPTRSPGWTDLTDS